LLLCLKNGITYNTIMRPFKIVIDTNVLTSALRSKYGASYKLLGLIDSGKFITNLSVPLVYEYEQVLKRMTWPGKPPLHYIDDILDYVCFVGEKWKIYYLWRPILSDPKDEMVLEVAVASQSEFIITYNKSDFRKAKQFGVIILNPVEFLKKLEVKNEHH
jgi:putative PIN family toxin of toxin-antitoxin system